MSAGEPFEEINGDNLAAFDAAPQVRARSSRWTAPLGVVGAVLLGGVVFLQMSAGRVAAQSGAPSPLPPPAVASAAPRPVAPVAPPQRAESDASRIAANEAAARLQAPALIVDLSQAHAADETAGAAANPQAITDAIGQGLTADERFSARLSSGAGAAHARILQRPDATIAQGAIITGVLETAINSDLPGYTRALVTRDVRSFDGTRVLAPRGSRLIGQYRSGLALGQSRAFVIWTRLIRPDGVSIDLDSPGADALGRGGLEGETDRHFFQRFGGAILLSLIGVAGDVVSSDNNPQVVIGVSRGGESAASAAVGEEINIPPTVRVDQGTPIRIFVSRDLDFSTVEAPGAAR